MGVFRVLLLVILAVSALGGIAGGKDDKKPSLWLFGGSGAFFLLTFIVERM